MQTGSYRCGVPAMEEKFLEKPVTFPFRSREADRRFRENSHLPANLISSLSVELIADFYTSRKMIDVINGKIMISMDKKAALKKILGI